MRDTSRSIVLTPSGIERLAKLKACESGVLSDQHILLLEVEYWKDSNQAIPEGRLRDDMVMNGVAKSCVTECINLGYIERI